jgi:hypothetical protein
MHTGQMISRDLASRLQQAGVTWMPTAGDRFFIPAQMDDEVFTISDMVVEVHEVPGGRHFDFNGTTEWALDTIAQSDVVWLPREEQLRTLLGEAFLFLQATPGGFIVAIEQAGQEERHIDIDAECAYARAVLSLHTG